MKYEIVFHLNFNSFAETLYEEKLVFFNFDKDRSALCNAKSYFLQRTMRMKCQMLFSDENTCNKSIF